MMNLSRAIRSLKPLRTIQKASLTSIAPRTSSSETVPKSTFNGHLQKFNGEVEPLLENPHRVLKWAMNRFKGQLAMSTSFGIQSAILLHLATSVKPDIPVIWVDTGYLPKETYEYAELLTEALDLNLVVKANTEWSPARMEAKYGNLWETDHQLYGKMRKVQPLVEGIEELKEQPLVMLSGLRSSQTKARANMKPVGVQHSRFKLLPILKMTDSQVEEYFDKFDLPRHPLEAKGYVTVGDWHSSRPLEAGEDSRNTRFGGKFQECGLHVDEVESESSGEAVEGLESFSATGIEALLSTKAHEETETAVIMVKKIMEDGSFCRKCDDVQRKLEQDGTHKWVGETIYADLRDSSSAGIKLAKHFDVQTAPFFLTRTKEEESVGEEWKVAKAYLPLKKSLAKRASR